MSAKIHGSPEEAAASIRSILAEYGLRWTLNQVATLASDNQVIDIIRRDRDSWRTIAKQSQRSPDAHRPNKKQASVSQETVGRVEKLLSCGARPNFYLKNSLRLSERQVQRALKILQDQGKVRRVVLTSGRTLFQLR